MTEPPRIGLVLGAGGTSGAHWIRGVLDALQDNAGFRPEHACTLVGTSIGAIKAATVPVHRPVSAQTFETLRRSAEPPPRPVPASRLLTAIRRNGGRALALGSRSGAPDPLTWVEGVEAGNAAQVCSMRRWPPTRRVVLLDDSADPEREVAASAAVPFGAQAIEIDGGSHVDGAVWSVTNADVARPDGLDLLIVIAPLVTTDGGTLVSGLGRHQLAVELGPWRRASKPVLVFAPTSQEYQRRSDRPVHRRDGYACAESIIPSK